MLGCSYNNIKIILLSLL